MADEVKAAAAMNKWWRQRTGKDESPASSSSEVLQGLVDVDAAALSVLVVYARNMSVLAESRRVKLAELQDDVATLQRALLEAGRPDEP